MPRYMVEHNFSLSPYVPPHEDGAKVSRTAVGGNATEGVIWVGSYVSVDYTKTICIYIAPTIDAIRRFAARNNLPVDEITELRVLEPFTYR